MKWDGMGWDGMRRRNILSNSWREDDSLVACPGDTKRVVSHVAAPGKAGPADVDGGDDLEDGVVDEVGGNDVGYGDAEDDAAVAGVGCEGQACVGIYVDTGVWFELSGGCWQRLHMFSSG